jgi:hypothetical protein
MREIKFRVWCKYHNDWERHDLAMDMSGNIFHNGKKVCHQSEHIIMQYTGLKDKKGKEIYEGDILRCEYAEREIGIIEYHGNGFWIKQPSGTKELPHIREIIGNIYENPEL